MRLNKWLLPVYYIVLYIIPLNLRPLWIPDETRYAEISREMIASGNWIVPHLLGLRYFEKPIAGYWFNAIAQLLFGHTDFAVRFAQAGFTGLSALLIFWFAHRLWDSERKAVAAVLIYLSSLLVVSVGTYAVLDAMLTFWMNLAMVTFYLAAVTTTQRGRILAYAALGLACGLGFLTKGFIALAIPVIVAVPYMLYQRRFLELIQYGPIAIVVAAALSLPWSLRINALDPDYWHYFFWIQHIKRFASQHAQHMEPFWYYLPILAVGMLPWIGLVPAALRRGWRAAGQRRDYLYLLAWVVLPVAFFSIAKGKLPTYILPCFAPLAMLTAAGAIDRLNDPDSGPAFRINGLINLLFGMGCAVTLLILSQLAVPGHRPLFQPGQTLALTLAVAIFLSWGLIGLVQLARPTRQWLLAALCLCPLMYLLPFALPLSVVNSKMPRVFIAAHRATLAQAGTILSNDVGVAAAIAWALKRTHIDMFANKGELGYGLGYADARSRFVARADFPQWLARTRRRGSVVLFLRNRSAAYIKGLPAADDSVSRGKFTLLVYRRRPT